MMHILHITAHLGGGVGRVLSRLVEHSARQGGTLRHTVICLAPLEKRQFADMVAATGGELLIRPSRTILEKCIRQADIVQLEWWHHPAVTALLGSGIHISMRLLIWSHVSGLHTPALTPDFVALPSRFLFSSSCSANAQHLASLSEEVRQRTATVFSSGGFEDFPLPPKRSDNTTPRIGYIGSLTPAKLHPAFLDFVDSINDPSIKIDLIGDDAPGRALMAAAEKRDLADKLLLCGYRTNVADILSQLDILAYVLNPRHYGTTENALLEAMALGVVPVVLNNPAECCLVDHNRTGMIIESPTDFGETIDFLSKNPLTRLSMSTEAARTVRERFAIDATHRALLTHYTALMGEEKRSYDFRSILGKEPADWFLSAQGDEARRFKEDGSVDCAGELPHALREQSKGSVFHYARHFPYDKRLASWAANIPPLP